MTFRPLQASLPLFGVLLLALASGAGPATAAPADVALLKSYIGNYVGVGTLSGNPPQTVRCRFTLQPGQGDNVNYNGRCSAAGASFSLSGIMSYVAAKKRYEAAMTSSGGSGVAIGQKRSGGVVFSSKQQITAEGHTATATSTLALTGGTLRVDFTLVDAKTGKSTTGTIPFSKS